MIEWVQTIFPVYRKEITGEKRIFDVKPYIEGDWYGELEDKKVFSTVHPCGTTVAWEDGQDIAPHELYDFSVPVGGV